MFNVSGSEFELECTKHAIANSGSLKKELVATPKVAKGW